MTELRPAIEVAERRTVRRCGDVLQRRIMPRKGARQPSEHRNVFRRVADTIVGQMRDTGTPRNADPLLCFLIQICLILTNVRSVPLTVTKENWLRSLVSVIRHVCDDSNLRLS